MKSKLLLTLIFFVSLAFTVQAQSTVTETFTVYGNCGMCKRTIEKSLQLKKKEGVVSAVWNKDTKLMVVTYDTDKIDLMDIHKKIAASGYDTDKVRAEDEVYSNLHGCCQYDRKELSEVKE